MKTIKVSEEVHKIVIPYTTVNGNKKTISDVIKEKFSPLPSANLRDISFDGNNGKILVSDFYISEISPNINDMCAEICVLMDCENITDSWDIIKKSKKIEFDYFLGDEIYTLKCYKFTVDPHFGSADCVIVSLFVDDYMQFSNKKD